MSDCLKKYIFVGKQCKSTNSKVKGVVENKIFYSKYVTYYYNFKIIIVFYIKADFSTMLFYSFVEEFSKQIGISILDVDYNFKINAVRVPVYLIQDKYQFVMFIN